MSAKTLECLDTSGLECIMAKEVREMPNLNENAMRMREEEFAREYVLSGCNISDTSRKLKIDNRTANRYLKKEYVTNRVKELAEEMWRNTDARAEQLHKIALENDMADIGQRTKWLASVVKGDVSDMSMVKGEAVEIPPKLIDRLRASEQLNKMQSCYTQHIDLTGSMPIVINDNVGTDDD